MGSQLRMFFLQDDLRAGFENAAMLRTLQVSQLKSYPVPNHARTWFKVDDNAITESLVSNRSVVRFCGFVDT